ncbi:MAG TPA: hypothetical protein VHX64_07445 [Caulobacteraceae bacterium]|jgi:hypothetical protein|nr:hypothetical protein [Caulobacteraceae bacterium]
MTLLRNLTTAAAFAIAASASASFAQNAPPAAAAPPAAGASACPAPDSKDVAYIKNPKWLHHPSTDDVQNAYPPHELKELKTDHTVVDCGISDDGALQDCSVVEDQRPHLGFDSATLRLTKLYKMSPLAQQPAYTGLPDCVRKLGAPHVVIPMDWRAATTSWSGR